MCLGTPVLYCEIDERARAVLQARIADGSLPCAPIVDDITTLESVPEVDMIKAGFPCQGVSSCGLMRNAKDFDKWYQLSTRSRRQQDESLLKSYIELFT